jgi:hypothetical protein
MSEKGSRLKHYIPGKTGTGMIYVVNGGLDGYQSRSLRTDKNTVLYRSYMFRRHAILRELKTKI